MYQGKLTKNVPLLSIFYRNVAIGDDRKKINETVKFYKYCVDIVDKIAQKYSTKCA